MQANEFKTTPKIELHLHLDCSLSFKVVFKESPLKRTKYQGLKRNIKYASQRI